MIRKCLIGLEHPSPDSLDFKDRKVFASTVIWLEDQKIRHLKIEKRATLRKTNNLQQWETEYYNYKNNLKMPAFQKNLEEMVWLLCYAARLEYLDFPTKYNEVSINNAKKITTNVPNMKSKNIFDNFDSQNPEFERGIKVLVNQFGFLPTAKPSIMLEAAALVINQNKEYFSGKPLNKVKGTPMHLEEKYMASKDRKLDLSVKILRFNQIYKLRKLQTKINEALAAIQSVTADPKTDTKLGKVGF